MPDVEWIRKLCLSFADVTEDMPWADDLCFKVHGKNLYRHGAFGRPLPAPHP